MGRRIVQDSSKSHTLPPSPTHSLLSSSSSSSSSSDFEFTISISPRRKSTTTLCPADELFYKGQLLPLHLSPRISMVRTLLLSSSSTSSSSSSSNAATTTTSARESTGSTISTDSCHLSLNSDLALFPDSESSRPSSVTEDDEFKRLHNHFNSSQPNGFQFNNAQMKKSNKYFSFSRFSSVFRKTEHSRTRDPDNVSGSSVKRMSNTAKEVIRKYLKKVKPLYEKLKKTEKSTKETEDFYDKSNERNETEHGVLSHSFSGNLRYPRLRKRRCVSSCPSSMRSSPSHSGVLSRSGLATGIGGRVAGGLYGDTSSMEELHSAIQGAIAHCKSSLIQNKTTVSNEI